MKIIILGSIVFTKNIIDYLIKKKIQIDGIIGKKQSKINSDHFDIVKKYRNKIDSFYTKDINDKKTFLWLQNKKPDLIICLGWSNIIHYKILKIPKFGIIGYHPTDLPNNKGRHPIIWPIILGLKKTASTFFLMNKKVDDGKIISKKIININKNYTVKDLYKKLNKIASYQIYKILINFKEGKVYFKKRHKFKGNFWRKRNFEDGKIDWRMDAENILNLVRALGKPYVGSHFISKNKVIKVWKVKIVNSKKTNLEPGKIIKIKNSYPIIKCGKNSIMLLEYYPKLKLKLNSYL